jgi:hypothetical protein
MNLLKTKYGLGCKALSNNSNSLMYYEVPGGSVLPCPKLNCLVWGKMTKKPDGTPYLWGDADPTPYLSGYEWGYSCAPFIIEQSLGVYQVMQGDWIDNGSTLTYVAGWEMSFDGINWIPPVGTLSTTLITDDTYRPIPGVTQIRAIVKVISVDCPTGTTYTTIPKII